MNDLVNKVPTKVAKVLGKNDIYQFVFDSLLWLLFCKKVSCGSIVVMRAKHVVRMV